MKLSQTCGMRIITNTWLNKSALAKLHTKTEKGNNFFELSNIVDGCIELLAVGGLVIISGKSVEPFLGSSVKPLNRAKVIDGDVITEKVLISKQHQVVGSERLLRHYYKRDSLKPWSFHMKSTYDVGFFPHKPFAYNHLLVLMLNTITKSSMLNRELKVPNFFGSSFLELYNAMAITGKWKMVINIAKDIETGAISFNDIKKNAVKNKSW
ncbi:hypothetical protein MAM1_0330c09751 [Mucor ambiguus]|uniref:Uncharacterized protein n=1 Tax=Mucor ambiguus TaxID=91626 RepID=A0A0C9N6K8_9FUNG|nr:hypothetical protein MAM1_0330c09751 [Mucor ambiguus]